MMPGRTPHQERSRRTEQAILEAAAALMQQKSFADISVAELARAAGVSVGGFYARFESKDRLLQVIEQSILDDFAVVARAELAPGKWVGQGIQPIVAAYARLLVANFRTHRTAILQILRYVQAAPVNEPRLRAFNVEVHDRMRALLLERRAEIGRPDPERAINLGLYFCGAAAREAVLTKNLEVYPVQVTDEELAAELAAAFHAYLAAPRRPAAARP